METNNFNESIKNSIRAIAQGSARKRIESGAVQMGGVGTSRMITGWVSKIHLDESDSEYDMYKGTIDVTEFYDEKFTEEPVTYKGVRLSSDIKDDGGFVIIPSMFSDVSILIDSGAANKYVVDYTHASVVQVESRKTVKIGVSEVEDMDEDDEDSPDYDELDKTGNDSYTEYTATKIVTVLKNKDGDLYRKEVTEDGYSEVVDESRISVNKDGIAVKIADSGIDISSDNIVIGKDGKTNPMVKGTEMSQLLKDVLLECASIATPTLMGTMPPINFQNFTQLMTRIDSTLSDVVFTKE